MSSQPLYGTVENEDCTLKYWHQGSGPLLIFVPGGNGHGRQYNHIMSLLSSKYHVATFDRRQMSASNVKGPSKDLNPAQQARDIIAVMRAIGYSKTSVFGSSGGGVIALQLAVSYPTVVEHMICHEAPTSAILSAMESTESLDFTAKLKDIYRDEGAQSALNAFTKKIMVGAEDSKFTQTPEEWNLENFFTHELIFSYYCPDLYKIVENGTSIAVAYGKKSIGAMYYRTVLEQAKRLECEVCEFPGSHYGFEVQPKEFAPVLIGLLRRLEEKQNIQAVA